jgi:hypothetical protein
LEAWQEKKDFQQRDDIALPTRVLNRAIGGHPNVEATPENGARDVDLDRAGKKSLVDDRKHIVAFRDVKRAQNQRS